MPHSSANESGYFHAANFWVECARDMAEMRTEQSTLGGETWLGFQRYIDLIGEDQTMATHT